MIVGPTPLQTLLSFQGKKKKDTETVTQGAHQVKTEVKFGVLRLRLLVITRSQLETESTSRAIREQSPDDTIIGWLVQLDQLLSHVSLFATPQTVESQAPLSMGFSRQEHWSGLPFPSSDTLIWDHYLQKWERINFYYFKPHSLWYFVMAALCN